MPREFYSWAVGLTDAQLAAALVGASLCSPTTVRAPDALGEITSELLRSEVPDLTRLPAPHAAWRHALEPGALGEVYRDARERAERQLNDPRVHLRSQTVAIQARRVETRGDRGPWIDALRALWGEQLSLQLVLHSPTASRPTWHWPLRVGVLTDYPDLGGFEGLLEHWWHGRLFTLATARTGARRFDLLLVDRDQHASIQALDHFAADGTAVVLLGDSFYDLATEVRSMRDTQRVAEASLVARSPGITDRYEWLQEVIAELAHARPIHDVLEMAAHNLDLPAPRIVADRNHLPALDLPNAVDGILAEVERALHELDDHVEVGLGSRLTGDLGLADVASLPEVAARFRDASGSLLFDGESEGATTIAAFSDFFSRAVRASRRSAAARDVADWTAGAPQRSDHTTLRFLRARVCQGDQLVARGPLLPRTSYKIAISVGPPTPEWLVPNSPFAEPHGPPDDPHRGWRLRVVVWEPSVLPEPVEHALWLPQSGPSPSVQIRFETPEQPRAFGARVVILHGNRVLQTGVLSVGDSPTTWSVDAAPEPDLASIDDDKWFGASIVLNNTTAGTPTATTVQDSLIGVADLNMDVFNAFTLTVHAAVSRIAEFPDDFEGIDADGTVELFIELAQAGFNMRRALIRGTMLDETRLSAASRMQIVSTKALTFFPAEFVYAFDPPDSNAVLCSEGVAALRRGEGTCRAAHPPTSVCPCGFWGISKVIERHQFVKQDHLHLPGPFRMLDSTDNRDAVALDPLREVLYAASDKADGFDDQATDRVETAARSVASGTHRVTDWAAWKGAVADRQPSMLLLVPHFGTGDVLQIGADSDVKVIDDPHVRSPAAPDHPLVLLLGCRTLITQSKFNDFVHQFFWSGARAVLATYGTILGRHAAPAAEVFLDELATALETAPTERLGVVLLRAKRRLLAQGQPMVLGLTAHGDADMILERRS